MKKRKSTYKDLLLWKKKHEKHGYLNKEDSETIQKMAIDAYMTDMLTQDQFGDVTYKTVATGKTLLYILDEIKVIYRTVNVAFKEYDAKRRAN